MDTTRLRIRAARTTPTAVLLALLVAGLVAVSVTAGNPAVTWLAAAAAGIFTVLLIETLLPQYVAVEPDVVRVRVGLHKFTVPREQVCGAEANQTRWVAGPAIQLRFLDRDGNTVEPERMLLTVRGPRGIATTTDIVHALNRTLAT